MPTYYYQGRSGDSFVDATLHQSSVCCPDPARPIAESTVESIEDPEFCPDCVPLESDSGSESEDSEMHDGDKAQLIEEGVCPWCGEEYANVGAHASQMHAEEWAAFKDNR